jgi:hypothetical protein
MNIRVSFRRLGIGFMVALAIFSFQAAQAHALPKKQTAADKCRARGYEWNDTQGCADKHCPVPGNPLGVSGGTNVVIDDKIYMCDGYTGTWKLERTAPTPSQVGSGPTVNQQ